MILMVTRKCSRLYLSILLPGGLVRTLGKGITANREGRAPILYRKDGKQN